MSESKYEPYNSGGVWCWTCATSPATRVTCRVPYRIFLELEGGEFGEPDTGEKVRYYPTREAALAALEAAKRTAEGVP